ncbi:hypothetical protein [Granulicella arctica]|uniref:hypothetical protein n=1 Tax=Granulicella arctica TaxID=940613 RepID=UPI0021DFF07D|nr:hypothetical protein [Granulicella arctica]
MDENLELPETFDFEDLGLILQPDAEFFISNTALLEDVVEFNGIHMRSFRNRPYYTYLAVWALRSCYHGHLARGGKPNALMEGLQDKTK